MKGRGFSMKMLDDLCIQDGDLLRLNCWSSFYYSSTNRKVVGSFVIHVKG